jgi:hypothetical protein
MISGSPLGRLVSSGKNCRTPISEDIRHAHSTFSDAADASNSRNVLLLGSGVWAQGMGELPGCKY